MYVCECDKHCQIDEYLKNCTCVKSIIDAFCNYMWSNWGYTGKYTDKFE